MNHFLGLSERKASPSDHDDYDDVDSVVKSGENWKYYAYNIG